MRARGDARHRQLLTHPTRIDAITRPDDSRLGDLVDLLERTFADPNSVLGLDRIRQFLSEDASAARRSFHVVAAQSSETARVVGLSMFSYVPSANCGFSEYLVVDQHVRSQGLGRALFDSRKTLLDADAVRHGHSACNGLFIEVDSPWRTPPELLAAESLDALERLRIFRHLGFLRVALAYVQPPIAPGKATVEHMDLLCAPWSTDVRLSASARPAIATDWIVATLDAIWSAWAPSAASGFVTQLRQQLAGARDVALVDPLHPT